MTPSTNQMADRGLKLASVLAQNLLHGNRLRYMGGCRCAECRRANTDYERSRAVARKAGDWNGNVSADKARRHLQQLSQQGVGRRTVQAATDIGDSILSAIINGSKQKIRARTERKILGVTPDVKADHALVSGESTWKLIDALIAAGFTRGRIALELGNKRPALQLSRSQVTVRHAWMIERIHARLMASDEALVSAGDAWILIRTLRDEGYQDPQIARAIGMADGVLSVDIKKITRGLALLIESAFDQLMGCSDAITTAGFKKANPDALTLAKRLKSGKYRIVGGEIEERCSRCDQYWAADTEFFYSAKKDKDGLLNWCKACYGEWRSGNSSPSIDVHSGLLDDFGLAE